MHARARARVALGNARNSHYARRGRGARGAGRREADSSLIFRIPAEPALGQPQHREFYLYSADEAAACDLHARRRSCDAILRRRRRRRMRDIRACSRFRISRIRGIFSEEDCAAGYIKVSRRSRSSPLPPSPARCGSARIRARAAGAIISARGFFFT